MFNPIAIVASVPLQIDGHSYAVGDRLHVSAARFGALLVMGKARLATAVERRDEVFVTPTPPAPRRRRPADPVRPKRVYRRRDMTAE